MMREPDRRRSNRSISTAYLAVVLVAGHLVASAHPVSLVFAALAFVAGAVSARRFAAVDRQRLRR